MPDYQISLAAARVNAGMSQKDVARQMHITEATLVSWEKGNTEPKPSQARELEKIYNFPMDYIFFGSKSN